MIASLEELRIRLAQPSSQTAGTAQTALVPVGEPRSN